jgi:hypothetical protein
MIQRIQTLWLSLCTILSLLMLNGHFLGFRDRNNEIFTLGFNGLSSVSGNMTRTISSSILIPAILIIIPSVSVLAIFLYRKHHIQKIAVLVVIIASFVLCLGEAYYWNIIAGKHGGVLLPGIKMIFPLIIIILAILAFMGIRKDENILRSYDRLR